MTDAEDMQEIPPCERCGMHTLCITPGGEIVPARSCGHCGYIEMRPDDLAETAFLKVRRN